MKKKVLGLLGASLLVCTMIFTGCGSKEATDAAATQEAAQDMDTVADTYKVSFMDADGTTELSVEEVKSGECATAYTPEKENMVFMGWFATPSMTHEFDFSQPITADTQVFAGFVENVEDTRTFAIVGNGVSPLLSASSWGSVINEEHYLTKAADKNEYTITCDLAEGDEFQFATDSSWSDQRGGGYLIDTAQDGTEYFSVSGGLSDDTKKSNIKCVVTGNYTLTLTTNPDNEAFDKISFVYNGDAKAAMGDFTTTYYIKGAICTNWEDRYEDTYKFVEKDGFPTLTIELEEGDEFLLTSMVTDAEGKESVGTEYVRYSNISDDASKEFVDGSEGDNMIAKQAGSYTFIYHPDTKELIVGCN